MVSYLTVALISRHGWSNGSKFMRKGMIKKTQVSLKITRVIFHLLLKNILFQATRQQSLNYGCIVESQESHEVRYDICISL